MLFHSPVVVDLSSGNSPLKQGDGVRVLVGSGGLGEVVSIIIIQVIRFLKERGVSVVQVESPRCYDRQTGNSGNIERQVDSRLELGVLLPVVPVDVGMHQRPGVFVLRTDDREMVFIGKRVVIDPTVVYHDRFVCPQEIFPWALALVQTAGNRNVQFKVLCQVGGSCRPHVEPFVILDATFKQPVVFTVPETGEIFDRIGSSANRHIVVLLKNPVIQGQVNPVHILVAFNAKPVFFKDIRSIGLRGLGVPVHLILHYPVGIGIHGIFHPGGPFHTQEVGIGKFCTAIESFLGCHNNYPVGGIHPVDCCSSIFQD